MKPKQKAYAPLGLGTTMYGWMGMSPCEFAGRMKLASVRFQTLKKNLKFDAIAYSGSSGCAIAFSLATKHKIPLIYVRKNGEKAHSHSTVECNDKDAIVKKYLIVDDFVDTGRTIDWIMHSIEKQARAKGAYPATAVGVLCFDQYMDKDRQLYLSEGEIMGYSIEPQLSAKQQSTIDAFNDDLDKLKAMVVDWSGSLTPTK